MKKLIFVLLVPLATLLAEAHIYIGAMAGYGYEKLSNDTKSSGESFKLKAGYGDRRAYAFELSYMYTKNSAKIFSECETDKISFSADLIKSFDLHKDFIPYVKAGFGAGYLKTSRPYQNTLNFGSFGLGLGVLYAIDEHIDIELSYEYRNVNYESIDLIAQTLMLESDLQNSYLGINYRF